MPRDMTAKQFFTACRRHEIVFSMWQGKAWVGPVGNIPARLVSFTEAGTTRRAWLAALLKELEAITEQAESEAAR